MKVADILRIKGSVVRTVMPQETALLFSGHLRAAQIGALVVSADGNSIDGIVGTRPGLWPRHPWRQVSYGPHLRTDDESGRRLLA